jgi:alcohol dehydrogenase (cytochrome c)
MYITAGYATMALDAATCRPKWRHDWNGAIPTFPNRGVAVKDGRVVRGTTDGYLITLDAATGALLWARRVADVAKGEMFTMAPLIYDDLVFIGPALSEFAIRGWVAAYRLQDGERVWRFNIVPEPGEPGAETWKQDASIPIGGGAVWTPVSLDVARELLLVPAANPPDFPSRCAVAEPLTNSLVAAPRRQLAWYDQMVPLDATTGTSR